MNTFQLILAKIKCFNLVIIVMNGIILVGVVGTKDILREIKIAESTGFLKFGILNFLVVTHQLPCTILAIDLGYRTTCNGDVHSKRTFFCEIDHLGHIVAIIHPVDENDGPMGTRNQSRVFGSDGEGHRTSIRSLNQLKMQVEVAGCSLGGSSLREKKSGRQTQRPHTPKSHLTEASEGDVLAHSVLESIHKRISLRSKLQELKSRLPFS